MTDHIAVIIDLDLVDRKKIAEMLKGDAVRYMARIRPESFDDVTSAIDAIQDEELASIRASTN